MNAERFFDDLARRLAEPMPRRRAVRILGVTLATAAVPGMAPGRVFARPAQRTCDLGCGENVKACPRLVNLAPVWDFCCGSPAKRYDCVGDLYNPKCRDTCGGPRDIPCPSNDIDVDGCPKFVCCKRPEFIGCVDGECIPNSCPQDPGQVACGKSCCDDSCCDRIFSRKDPYCCSYEEAWKGTGEDMEIAAGLAALAFLGLGLVVATGGLGAIVLAGLGVGVGLGGIAGKIIADDPPDPKYKKLFRPRFPHVAPVPREGLSPAAARALDRLIANRLRAGAYAIAYIRSIEKAQGAEKARDNTWARRHRKAAAGYAREAARTLERDRSLSAVALRELQREGFVDTGVSLAQVRQAQQRIRQRGLPVEMTRAFRFAGVDDARIAAYRKAVSQLDPKLAVGVGAFGSATDRRLAEANAAMVKALRRAARA